MKGRIVEFDVVVDGRKVTEYNHRTEGAFIEHVTGKEFALRLRNLTDNRILVIPSVDGISALDGEVASYDSPGYVLRPNQTADIRGWRRGNDSVAKFFFADEGDSYGARVGKSENLGIMGLAVYEEKRPKAFERVRRRSMSLDSGVAVAAGPMGTGFGEEVSDRVDTTTFRKATSSPAEVLTVRYELRQKLVEMGLVSDKPQAFPGVQPPSSGPSVPAPPVGPIPRRPIPVPRDPMRPFDPRIVWDNIRGNIGQRSDCMHDNCPTCSGTGVRNDGLGSCIHGISCPCKKCSVTC